jgi:hypothetical protein
MWLDEHNDVDILGDVVQCQKLSNTISYSSNRGCRHSATPTSTLNSYETAGWKVLDVAGGAWWLFGLMYWRRTHLPH